MKFVINENQFNTLISEENIKRRNKILSLKKAILTALMFGALQSNNITQQINQNNFLNDKEKQELMVFTIENDKRYWQEIADDVVVTVYNAMPNQCNDDFSTTASGFKLDMDNIGAHKIIAVERTFMKEHGLKYGDVVKIEGTYKGLQDGVYQIQDTMNKRFANQDKVDVLVPNDIKYGGTLKDSFAKMYILRNKGYTNLMMKKMLSSI